MVRLAAAALGLVLLSAVVYFTPSAWLAGLLPGVQIMPLLSAVALVLSMVAAAAALRALQSTGKLHNDMIILARSIDMALKDVSARTDKDVATIGDMNRGVSREIEQLSERIATREDMGAAGPDNVVPHPSARRLRTAPALPEATSLAPDPGAIETAYRKAVSAGEFDVALQPIVSVSKRAATGFEVFANLTVDGGQHLDLRRLAEQLPGTESAAFERILVTSALHAGRKRLGVAGTAMPLHVAISEALLGNATEIAPLLDMLQFYPDLVGSIVLSVPIGIADAPGVHSQALGLLAAKGVRFAAEGWDEAAGAGRAPSLAGLAFLKIPANRLLDREKQRRRLAPASTIIDRAAADQLEIIATEVASDEDAVSLIDLGIDLMAGPRFGGPKRLRPEAGNRPGRLALI